MIPLGFLGYFLFLLSKSLHSMFQDWKLGRELDEIQANAESRQEELKEANVQRLATGCEHDFKSGAHGLPPNVCRHCGMEKTKPTGGCDHVWQIEPGPIPTSVCQKCGRKHSVTEQLA